MIKLNFTLCVSELVFIFEEIVRNILDCILIMSGMCLFTEPVYWKIGNLYILSHYAIRYIKDILWIFSSSVIWYLICYIANICFPSFPKVPFLNYYFFCISSYLFGCFFTLMMDPRNLARNVCRTVPNINRSVVLWKYVMKYGIWIWIWRKSTMNLNYDYFSSCFFFEYLAVEQGLYSEILTGSIWINFRHTSTSWSCKQACWRRSVKKQCKCDSCPYKTVIRRTA